MDEQFVERYVRDIIGFFRGMVRDDVEDLVQETFVRYFATRGRMRPGTEPCAYLYGIAWNVWREHLRRTGRARTMDPDVEPIAALDPGPSTIATRRRDHRMLLEALRRLPAQHQAALQMHYWCGVRIEDIAELMGVSYSAMRDRMGRARQLLAQELATLEQTTPLMVSTGATDGSP